MTQDEFIDTVAKLVAGLQVPVSLGLPLGEARDPWGRLSDLSGFGWKTSEEIAESFRQHLSSNETAP